MFAVRHCPGRGVFGTLVANKRQKNALAPLPRTRSFRRNKKFLQNAEPHTQARFFGVIRSSFHLHTMQSSSSSWYCHCSPILIVIFFHLLLVLVLLLLLLLLILLLLLKNFLLLDLLLSLFIPLSCVGPQSTHDRSSYLLPLWRTVCWSTLR